MVLNQEKRVKVCLNLDEELLEFAEKRLSQFIDARLAWASCGALCCEVHKRICNPLNDD